MSRKIQEKHLVEANVVEYVEDISEMLGKGENKYLLINVLGRRARDLNRGARALVQPSRDTRVSVTETALSEGAADKLKIKTKQKSTKMVSLVKND